MSGTVFVATVDTYYQTMAVADTAHKARLLALARARKQLHDGHAPGWHNATLKNVEEHFGVTVTRLAIGEAVIVT